MRCEQYFWISGLVDITWVTFAKKYSLTVDYLEHVSSLSLN